MKRIIVELKRCVGVKASDNIKANLKFIMLFTVIGWNFHERNLHEYQSEKLRIDSDLKSPRWHKLQNCSVVKLNVHPFPYRNVLFNTQKAPFELHCVHSLISRSLFENLGSMDQVRLESDFSHSYSHGCIKSSTVCYAQWTQYMEITYFTCPTERQRKLHVPSEYGSDEISGKLISPEWKLKMNWKSFSSSQPENRLGVSTLQLPECLACIKPGFGWRLHSGAY